MSQLVAMCDLVRRAGGGFGIPREARPEMAGGPLDVTAHTAYGLPGPGEGPKSRKMLQIRSSGATDLGICFAAPVL